MQQQGFVLDRRRHRSGMATCLRTTETALDEVTQLLAPYARRFHKPRGSYLHRMAATADTLFWVADGVVSCGVVDHGGLPIITGFVTEGGYACASTCFQVRDALAERSFLKAETSVTGYAFDLRAVRDLRGCYPVLQVAHVKLLEHAVRSHFLHTATRFQLRAEDRLAAFRRTYAGLEERVAQKTLASYFGVSPQYMCDLLGRNPPV